MKRYASMRRAAGLAALLAAAAAQAGPGGYVPLTGAGERVLKACNPHNSATQPRCKVNSLPGEPGYALVAARSSAIVKNEVVVGTLQDRVWKDAQGNHIFGMRVQMNADSWDLSGLSFNVNDLFRQVLADRRVAIAYADGHPAALKRLQYAGRTLQGLNEPDPEEDDDEGEEDDPAVEEGEEEEGDDQPVRDNGWVDFRIDVNANDPDGLSSAYSPWLLVKTRAPDGFSVQPFALRVLNSDVEDPSQIVEVYLSGYQPN